jgi:hypothetical protein
LLDPVLALARTAPLVQVNKFAAQNGQRLTNAHHDLRLAVSIHITDQMDGVGLTLPALNDFQVVRPNNSVAAVAQGLTARCGPGHFCYQGRMNAAWSDRRRITVQEPNR